MPASLIPNDFVTLMYLPEFAVTALSKQIIVNLTPEWTLLLFRRNLKSKMFEMQVARSQQTNECLILVVLITVLHAFHILSFE